MTDDLSKVANALGLNSGQPAGRGGWDRYRLNMLQPGWLVDWQDHRWMVAHVEGTTASPEIELRREDRQRGRMAHTMIFADGTHFTGMTIVDAKPGHLPLDDRRWW